MVASVNDDCADEFVAVVLLSVEVVDVELETSVEAWVKLEDLEEPPSSVEFKTVVDGSVEVGTTSEVVAVVAKVDSVVNLVPSGDVDPAAVDDKLVAGVDRSVEVEYELVTGVETSVAVDAVVEVDAAVEPVEVVVAAVD